MAGVLSEAKQCPCLVDTALLKLEECGGIRDGLVMGASEDTFCEIVVWRRKSEVE